MRSLNRCSEKFLEEYEGGSINTASPEGNSASKNKDKADISNSLDLESDADTVDLEALGYSKT